MNDLSKSIFLLGGHDLEMVTIKKILENKKCRVEDNNLSWGAGLSSYQEIFNLEDPELKIYGIELKDDIACKDPRYVRIDHHDDYSYKKSSLEQIAEIIEHKLTGEEELIAANDKGYIPAMEKAGATKKQIEEIRRKDREAQGVSEEECKQAVEAIVKKEELENGVIWVHTEPELKHLVDQLYPYKSLIITSFNSFCAYGDIADRFATNFDIDYSGGDWGNGTIGFAGASHSLCVFDKEDNPEKKLEKVEKCMRKAIAAPFSKHIFLFPFKFDFNGNYPSSESCPFSRTHKSDSDIETVFNEKQYFYPFVQAAYYDDGTDNSNVAHYEMNTTRASYCIEHAEEVGGLPVKKTYRLDIESINLNLYSTGIGVLSFYLVNNILEQSTPEDILRINQYGRRIMPPFFAEIGNKHTKQNTCYRSELADCIYIQGLREFKDSDLFDDFTNVSQPWEPSGIITTLLQSLKIQAEPIIDDRMFVLSWYKNDKEMKNIASCSPHSRAFSKDKLNAKTSCKDFWYRYVFVDGKDATCYGNTMYKDLLKLHTYSRWEHPQWGTEYGLSRYSLVMLITTGAPAYLFNSFETIYVKLVEMTLVQRATILYLSEKLQLEGKDEEKKFSEWYEQYIKFLNKFRFIEVTAQEQGIEMYDMLCESMRIKEEADHLDNQFNEREEYLELQEQRNLDRLSVLAGIAVPVSIISGHIRIFLP